MRGVPFPRKLMYFQYFFIEKEGCEYECPEGLKTKNPRNTGVGLTSSPSPCSKKTINMYI